MRIAILAAAGLGALSLAACESQADKAAEAKSDAVKAEADVAATNLESRADAAQAAGNTATAAALEQQADATKAAADAKGDAIEQQAGKKD